MPRVRSESAKELLNVPANRKPDPTQEEILIKCREIQSEWDEKLEQERTIPAYRRHSPRVDRVNLPDARTGGLKVIRNRVSRKGGWNSGASG